MSNQPMMEVELYAFNGASGQFLLTPHEFDVDLDGNLYASLRRLEKKVEREKIVLARIFHESAADGETGI